MKIPESAENYLETIYILKKQLGIEHYISDETFERLKSYMAANISPDVS